MFLASHWVENNCDHHLSPKSGLKSYFWPFPDEKTWRIEYFREKVENSEKSSEALKIQKWTI
jgi:hypothetical protein